MNIWLISAFEPLPIDETRPMRFMGIADELLNKGHHVTFWSSSFNHFNKIQRVSEDITITINDRFYLKLVHTKPYKKNISVSRLYSHYYFSNRLQQNILNTEKPELIYLAFPPINTLKLVSNYARVNNIPLVIDIIDPWPDVVLNIIPSILQKPFKILLSKYYKILRNSFSTSSAIFSISDTYIQWARKFVNTDSVKYKVFFPAVDTTLYNQYKGDAESSSNSLKFIYAGTLGAYYDIETIIEAAKHFNKNEAEFIIAGDGPKKKNLEFRARGLDNIKFTGWLNSQDLQGYMETSHIGIAAYTTSGTQTVTYKLFDYLAAGLPILNSLDGEMQQILDNNRLGIYYQSENCQNLISGIQQFLTMDREKLNKIKKRAKEFAQNHGDKKVVYGNLVEQLEDIHRSN